MAALPFLSLSLCYTTSVIGELFGKSCRTNGLLKRSVYIRESLCSSHPFLSPSLHPSSTSSTLLRPPFPSPVSQQDSSGFRKAKFNCSKRDLLWTLESKYRNAEAEFCTDPTVNRCENKVCRRAVISHVLSCCITTSKAGRIVLIHVLQSHRTAGTNTLWKYRWVFTGIILRTADRFTVFAVSVAVLEPSSHIWTQILETWQHAIHWALNLEQD